MAREYRPDLAAQIKIYLDGEGLKYSFDSENGIFRFKMSLGDTGLIGHVDERIIVKKDAFQVQCISPLNAPENTRVEVAVFITYVNYRMVAGDFEMDFSDGEVMYKVDQYCADQIPSLDIVKRAIFVPLAVFDNNARKLAEVMLGAKTGKEAGMQDDD